MVVRWRDFVANVLRLCETNVFCTPYKPCKYSNRTTGAKYRFVRDELLLTFLLAAVLFILLGQLTISFREGEPITYTSYDDMEKDFVSGKVRRGDGNR